MRPLLMDLRRGPAPLLALGVLVLAGAPGASACQSAVLSLRDGLWLALPCVLAAGVWHGGAARRRGVDEALRSTPAPAQRRAAVEGGSLGLASASALALVLVALLAGGCASGPLSVGAVAVLAVAATGFAGLAIGRVFPAPMAAPLALFFTLVVASVFGGWTEESSKALLLLPTAGEGVTAAQLAGAVAAGQLLWFAGLGLAGWLAASGRWRAAALPAAAGLAGLLAVS